MQNRFFIKRCSRKRTVSRAFVTHHQEGMSFVGLFARAATRNVFTNSGRKKWDQEPRFGTASSADKDAPKSYRCTHRGRKQYGRMRLWRLHRLSGTRSQIFSGFWKDEDASEIFMNVRRVEARTPILSTPSPSSTHRQDATSSLFFLEWSLNLRPLPIIYQEISVGSVSTTARTRRSPSSRLWSADRALFECCCVCLRKR